MKKIAFILALVMVFAVALVACDETPAESSNPATESTPVENESTPVESTPVESTPDEESVPAESTPDESVPEEESQAPAAEVGELVSVGKTYTATEQFRQGGQDVNWGWDANAPVAYPDEDGVSLTDGVKDPGDSEYTNAVWAGYSYLVPSYAGYHSFVIDLGESMSLAQVSVAIASSALSNGIGSANTSFEVLVSEDGENWTSVGTVASGDDDGSVNFYEYSVNFSGNGRYVEVRVARDGWAFLSEIEVYAAK